MKKLLSIVVPCYNEDLAVPKFYDEVVKVCEEMEKRWVVEFEFVFVDDGSRDRTLAVIESELCPRPPRRQWRII